MSSPIKALNEVNSIPVAEQSIDSWIDFQMLQPKNPLDLIAYAKFGEVESEFRFSEGFVCPHLAIPIPCPFSIPSHPRCMANGTDDFQAVAEANQWNQQHWTSGAGLDLFPELRSIVFLRAGLRWKMQIPIHLTTTCENFQLSFRNNACTRGDAQGTVPVLFFAGTFDEGDVILELTLKETGQTSLGLVTTMPGNQLTMFVMECVII